MTTYANPLEEAKVNGGYSGDLTITRAAGNPGVPEAVFVESTIGALARMVLSREEAAELSKALLKVSGLQTAPSDAWSLAEVVREQMARRGVTANRVHTVTGISRHRLGKILSGELPMTREELELVANVNPPERSHLRSA